MKIIIPILLFITNSYAKDYLSKKYNEVTFLTSHNSYNYSWNKNRNHGPKFYLFPNQNYPVTEQLRNGVRAFMLDLHYYKGFRKKLKNKVILCHGGKACGFIGFEPAINVFEEIHSFLKENPKEIITLIFETYVKIEDLKKIVKKSHLIDFVHIQNPNQNWPSLKQMIKSNKRLVIFNDKVGEDNPPWNHDLFGSFAVETKYSYRSVKKFDCTLNRGNKNHSLFILNHFITRISGAPLAAKKANKRKILTKRINECYKEHNKLPNFLTIDFTKFGDALEVINEINQLDV